MRRLSCVILVTWVAAIFVSEAVVTNMEASLIKIDRDNSTFGFFQCTVHKSQSFFLDHVMAWSHVGRDGKEKFLSLNWELVQDATYPTYATSSKTDGTAADKSFYFIISKEDLNPSDNGEFICRLFDYERNLIQETSVQVTEFDAGLALSPYIVKETSGRDVTIKCMTNFTDPSFYDNNHVVISHVMKNGTVKNVAMNGMLADSTNTKYSITTNTTLDGMRHYIVTIKGLAKTDEGHFVCGIHTLQHSMLQETNISIIVDEPRLIIEPYYFLNAPTDSEANFRCSCDQANLELCNSGSFSWVFEDKYTHKRTEISRNGIFVGDSTLYDISPKEFGSVNLTIKGVVEKVTEGIFICSVGEAGGQILAEADVPVTVSPVALGVLGVTNEYPARSRVLCTVTGTQWDDQYLTAHSIVWLRTQNGTTSQLSSNGNLEMALDRKKFSLFFDPQRVFSILDVKDLTEEDHGQYSCHLVNNNSKAIIRQETISIYGKGKGTLLAGSYGGL